MVGIFLDFVFYLFCFRVENRRYRILRLFGILGYSLGMNWNSENVLDIGEFQVGEDSLVSVCFVSIEV